MIRRSLLLALSFAAAAPAWAVRDAEDVYVGIEPTRVRVSTASGQAYHQGQPAWQAFLAADGKDWRARFDEATGTPHRMWGPGIELGDLRNEEDVGDAVLAFIGDHAELFGVTDGELSLRSVNRWEGGDAWYVDVDVLRFGLPIWRGGLTFRIKYGKLVMMGADAYPETPIVNRPGISRREAVGAALRGNPSGFVRHTDIETTALLLPLEESGKVVLRAAWEVRSKTALPVGHWVSFVDAESGEVLNLHNEVRFLTGSADAQIDNRLGAGGLVVRDLPFATISNGSNSTTTSANGGFTIGNASSYTMTLNGPRLRMFDQAGGESSSFTNANPTFDGNDFANVAPLTTWVYTHEAQQWARDNAPEVPIGFQKINAYVNISGSCNAYYDGAINFLQAGGGCRNTGRLADVIYHEWGHGFHGSSLLAGFWDGSLGEGAADVYSFLLTDDPRIAPNFFTGSGGTLRTLDNNNRYPDDFVNNSAYVHFNGLIFGGSMYDTFLALSRDFGASYARDTIGDIFVGTLKGGPGVPESFDEAVFADDDDGNLSNGTPHLCQIIQGFGAHGLGDAASFNASVDHTPILRGQPGRPTIVSANLDSAAPACLGGSTASSGTVFHRVNGGAWQQTALSPSGGDLSATLPAFELGDIVTYYLRLDDGTGGFTFSPDGGAIKPYTYFVGDVLEVGCDDFEGDDGGFTNALIAGTDVAGANDWLWGTPFGQAGDPVGGWSGSNVWGNDLGESGWNGEYQNDKHTRLSTRTYDTQHFTDAVLAYRRWLTVEDGFYDRASILADGQTVWTNWATNPQRGDEHHIDTEWALHVVDLAGQGDDGSVQVSWDLVSDGGLTFGGWNIDDVCIFAPATADNRLGITDFDAAIDDRGVVMSWTQPAYGPIERVLVVRNYDGRLPQGVGDGDVVYEMGPVKPGQPASFIDAAAPTGTDLTYAVYAFDGADWLSWTVDGWNAASVGERTFGTK